RFGDAPTGVPSNYSSVWATSYLRVARRNLAAASENPGTFTGGSDGGSAVTIAIRPAPENEAPTAHAGPDQEVHVGDTVNLDGTGSSDAEDGTNLDYAWTVVDD